MEMTQVNTVIVKLQKSAYKWGGDLNLVLNLEIEHLSQLAINKVDYRWN